MLTPSAFVAFVVVAFLTAVVTVARPGRPGPKRTHLSEREDSERTNPFDDLSAGAEHAGEGCHSCGSTLESENFRYCVSCLTGSVVDD